MYVKFRLKHVKCVIKRTFCWCDICYISGKPYLCNVFLIVLDLRLTRLEYGGTPFFMSIRDVR